MRWRRRPWCGLLWRRPFWHGPPTGESTGSKPVLRVHRRAALATASTALLAACTALSACKRNDAAVETPERVVLYTSVDEAFARVVVDRYSARTGAKVAVIFDSEAGKTTGFVNRIIAEGQAGRPRGDVFFSSELFHTILLARDGWLEPYDSPAAADVPGRFHDPQHRWTALAVRARVIAFDPNRIGQQDLPTDWEALARPPFVSQTAIANPLFGTTRGHVAAMFALWGGERARAFLAALRDGEALIADSNSAAVRAILAGRIALAMTDTDDVWVARQAGASLDLRYLDMGHGGTLLIPCSVAIIKGGPNPRAARSLTDYLVSVDVERMLAESDSRNVPVRDALRKELNMEWPPETPVDFDAVADSMDEAATAVREILIR